MLAHLSFLTVVLVVAYLFHRYQLVSDHLLPFIRSHYPRFNQYSPLNTFEDQRNAGLSSSNFDLESNNMAAGDSRQGLDAAGSAEIQRIMREEGVSFDEARLRRHQHLLARNNVDPSGMPLDSKAITRL
ncbi:Protein of unknown function DUF2015 [Phaffia rhodozyma]|uniref:Uncharacterized protein n=1 Tax=Phaffia rhodozyma TaxID=264483 RepID=A0A0F7SN60_PHARH|nr:Protein of unknown function DUF2015 [Phaffia rhodozyma]